MRWLRYSANVLATFVLGALLSHWISNLPYEFSPLPKSIALVMRALGIDTVKNADDVEIIGLLVIIVFSMMIAATLVWLANAAARHWRRVA